MKHALHALIVVVMLLAARTSFAAPEPDMARARFASTVGLDLLREATCAMPTAAHVEGHERTMDFAIRAVDVDQRCSAAPSALEAIPLRVWVEPGQTRQVVVEAPVPDGTSMDAMLSLLAQVATHLQERLLHAMTPPAITTVRYAMPLSTPLDLPRGGPGRLFVDRNGWAHIKPSHPGRTAAIVLGSVAAGVAVFAGCIALLSNSGGMLHFNGW